MTPRLTKGLRAALVFAALILASIAIPQTAEARPTGAWPACAIEKPGAGIWVVVCDNQGGRVIDYGIANPTSANRCVRVSWWNAGQRIQLHPRAGWKFVAANTTTGNPIKLAAYSAWADATIEIIDCSTSRKIATYLIGAANNPNRFI